MSKLSELANQASAEIAADQKTKGVGIDPVTIALLIEVVVKIMLYIYDCWKANRSDSLKRIRKPGFFQRLVLKRVVRKVLTKAGAKDQIGVVYDAVLKMASMVTSEDLDAVLAEVGRDMTVPRLAVEYGEV